MAEIIFEGSFILLAVSRFETIQTMKKSTILKSLVTLALVSPFVLSQAAAKPLKVFILSGQSNMQGHATVPTLEHLTLDPETKPLHEKIFTSSGVPKVYDDVHITYLSGDGSGDKFNPSEKKGPLTVGFGASRGGPKIGPELTFGITMREKLDEPILIIKTAWGGKSLNTDFRPPSAEPHFLEDRRENSGEFYRKMMEYVDKVLANPGDYHPAYDPAEGYEIAGFVWFQGFNDSVDKKAYPGGDMSAYSNLLAHFIRDVRKDLNAPDMPFVIGVIGTVGRVEDIRKFYEWRNIDSWFDGITAFRNAMAAPAALPEFKGNVAAVLTENSMDPELVKLQWDTSQYKKSLKNMTKEEKDKAVSEKFTERELRIANNFISNKGFHYFGSGKFFALVGESFANAILDLKK